MDDQHSLRFPSSTMQNDTFELHLHDNPHCNIEPGNVGRTIFHSDVS